MNHTYPISKRVTARAGTVARTAPCTEARHYPAHVQAGFTLIEMAIVLVIVGLLLTGVLKGRELVTAARVRALSNQAAAVQAAYYGFLDSYRHVAGDMPASEAAQVLRDAPAGVGGNGNGRLDTAEGGLWTEPNAFWAHLSAAGYLNGRFVGATAAPSLDVHAPRNAYGGFMLLARSSDYLDASDSPPERLNLVLGRGIPAEVLRRLDLGLDDGLPASGQLRAVPAAAGARYAPVASAGSAECIDRSVQPARWNVRSGASDCNATLLW